MALIGHWRKASSTVESAESFLAEPEAGWHPAHRAGRVRSINRYGAEFDISCFPAPSEVDFNPRSSTGNSLFPKPGNTPRSPPNSGRITSAGPAGEPDSREFPCTFPTHQGRARRDEFAPDCTHRHLVTGCRDFTPEPRGSPRNSRAFAGFWPRGLSESGPERANFGPMRGRDSRFSLLAIAAVRIRPRIPSLAAWSIDVNPARNRRIPVGWTVYRPQRSEETLGVVRRLPPDVIGKHPNADG
jgi:hypothetical protein